MYPFKRIFAYLIDTSIILFLVSIINGINIIDLVQVFIFQIVSFKLHSPFLFVITILIPILYNGIMAGYFGWTPGKRLMNLRVRNEAGTTPGLGKGFLRETVKCAAISFLIIGMAWALYEIFTHRPTFYDKWFTLSVDDNTPVVLTDTQQKWREQHGEK